MSEWIEFSETSEPKDMQVVIISGCCNTPGYPEQYVEPAVYLEGSFHAVGEDEEGDIGPNMDSYMSNVTHWQPLPSAPELAK